MGEIRGPGLGGVRGLDRGRVASEGRDKKPLVGKDLQRGESEY